MLSYDPETGVFRWRRRNGSRCEVGQEAGSVDRYGYILIRVDKTLLRAHRLAWQYVHGNPPASEIDHINGAPSDNRIANLRLASRSQNIANAKRSRANTSGAKGVYWCRQQQKWRARITVDRRSHHLGHFSNIADAQAAYLAAAKRAFGKFARRA